MLLLESPVRKHAVNIIGSKRSLLWVDAPSDKVLTYACHKQDLPFKCREPSEKPVAVRTVVTRTPWSEQVVVTPECADST
jgi:hypothetical protein